MSAREIEALLAKRHKEDVFVPQCKSGPTHTANGSLLVLDAWALKKSWTNPRSDGYEIKVSRSDFVKDEKWESYLEFCTHFWFVCPWGLIDKAELPAGVGLVYVSKNAKVLRTVRKAARHEGGEVLHPALAQYVLQSRIKVRPAWEGRRQDAEYWRAWLAERRSQKELGGDVAAEFALRFGEIQIKIKMGQAEARNQQLEKVQAWCAEVGIDVAAHRWDLEEVVKRKISPTTATAVGEKLDEAVKAAQAAFSAAREAKKALDEAGR